MTDPIEIIADAINDSRDYGVPAAKYVATKLEAAGYRLLSAEGVTDEMAKPIEEIMMDLFDGDWGSRRMISAERKLQIAKSVATKVLRAAPLFGKGSEKPAPTPTHGKNER